MKEATSFAEAVEAFEKLRVYHGLTQIAFFTFYK